MTDLIPIVAQFGPAGLIGLMWLAERRQAAKRERHLSEAHRRIMAQEPSIAALLSVVRDNTRAIASLEGTQRRVIEMIAPPRQRAASGPPAPRAARLD